MCLCVRAGIRSNNPCPLDPRGRGEAWRFRRYIRECNYEVIWDSGNERGVERGFGVQFWGLGIGCLGPACVYVSR